jgi:hypothetical protein
MPADPDILTVNELFKKSPKRIQDLQKIASSARRLRLRKEWFETNGKSGQSINDESFPRDVRSPRR